MKTFYFNTGVQPYKHNPPVPLCEGHVMRGGTMQIPFDCEDVPANATFVYASDNPESKRESNLICREIHNSALCSKYAFFKVM